MKKRVMGSVLMFWAFVASAHAGPGAMRAIDAKVPTVNSPASDMPKVKALREEGDKRHQEGKHDESVQAKKLLSV